MEIWYNDDVEIIMKSIYGMSLKDLEEYFLSHNDKKFRATQIYDWLYRKNVTSFDDMTNLKKDVIELLKNDFYLRTLELKKVERDTLVNKYLFYLQDGEKIEAVLMRHDYGNSICISTQVGCNMGCKFCESGRLKKVRNLTAGEMTEQILKVQEDIGDRVSHVVLMGIGEPFDNYDGVVTFLKNLVSPEGLNISPRNISLSTCGLVDKMYKFAQEGIPLNLTVSLHATTDTERARTMPIANKWSIAEILQACDNYFAKTGRRYIFEYSLIEGENCDRRHAEELVALLKGRPCHVNLIRLNEVKERTLKATDEKSAYRFLGMLERGGLSATLRRQIGSDIGGACGQLRASYLKSGAKDG